MKYELPIGIFKIPIPANEYYGKKTNLQYTEIVRDAIENEIDITLPIFNNGSISGILFPDIEGNIENDNIGVLLYFGGNPNSNYNGTNFCSISISYFTNNNKTNYNHSGSDLSIQLNSGYSQEGIVSASFNSGDYPVSGSEDVRTTIATGDTDRILILDTRFLKTHNFYCLGYGLEADYLFAPTVYISNFTDLRSNSKTLGIFRRPDAKIMLNTSTDWLFAGVFATSTHIDFDYAKNTYLTNNNTDFFKIKKLQIGSFLSENLFYGLFSPDNILNFTYDVSKMKDEKDFYKKIQIEDEQFYISLTGIGYRNKNHQAVRYTGKQQTFILFKEKGE